MIVSAGLPRRLMRSRMSGAIVATPASAASSVCASTGTAGFSSLSRAPALCAPRTASITGLPPSDLASAALQSQQSRSLFGQTFDVGEIHAVRRDGTGSLKAQAARQKGMIPGIIYGYDAEGNDKVDLVYVKEVDLRKEVNRRKDCFYNTLFDIVLEGKRTRVLPRDFQIHPFRPKAISINWLRYRPGAYPGAKLDIPLKSFNEERSPGLKEGGWLLELVHKLPVYASGDSIPDYLMMDLRGLKAGDKIMASHVELNDGLILRSKVRDFAIARLLGSRKGAEATAEEGDAKKPAAAAAKAAPAKAS